MMIKGLEKMAARCGTTSAVDRQLLDENLVRQLVTLADIRGFGDFSCMVLVAWEFLLRVQSEAVDLQCGNSEDATALPSHRHSGMWIDTNGALVLRLQRRKHRPQGSLLRRKCLCNKNGPNLCVVHRLQPVLSGLGPGGRLFNYSAVQFLSLVKRFLTQLCVEHAQLFTLKASRAGKATALASAGNSLGLILAAGEWRSRAVLNYVDEDAFDGAQVVAREMDASDCE